MLVGAVCHTCDVFTSTIWNFAIITLQLFYAIISWKSMPILLWIMLYKVIITDSNDS